MLYMSIKPKYLAWFAQGIEWPSSSNSEMGISRVLRLVKKTAWFLDDFNPTLQLE
jgi:hypothetical protein